MVVTGFMALTKDGFPTTLKQSGSNYSAVYVRNILNPNFRSAIITGRTESLKDGMVPNFTVMHHFLQIFNQFSTKYLVRNPLYHSWY